MSNFQQKSAKANFAFFQLTFVMVALSLLIDSFNGFLLLGLGIDPKLSAAYKLLLLFMMMYQIGVYSKNTLMILLILISLFTLGPINSLITNLNTSNFIIDFISALKILTSLIVFLFCVQVSNYWPELVSKYGERCLKISFYVLILNLFLGVMGYGFSSYGQGSSEGGAIGVKGFFFAGNEVSGLYILLFGIILHFIWQKNKVIYFLFLPVLFFCGFIIATKATMLSAVLLTFLIPLVNERNRIFNLTWLKIQMILPLIILIITLSFFLIPILETTGIWSRLAWTFEEKGLFGIILSGRDVFFLYNSEMFFKSASFFDIFFGIGRSGIGTIGQETVELDPADMFFWFGVFGFVVFIGIFILFIRTSFIATVINKSYWGPPVFIINIILLFVSIIAGHILTSGMLGILMGLVNGLAYADLHRIHAEKALFNVIPKYKKS